MLCPRWFPAPKMKMLAVTSSTGNTLNAWTKGEPAKTEKENCEGGVQGGQLQDKLMKHNFQSTERRREQQWSACQPLAVCWERSSPGVLQRRKYLLGNVRAHNKEPWSFDLTSELSNPSIQWRIHRGTKAASLAQREPSQLPGHVPTGQSWLSQEPETFPSTDFSDYFHFRQIKSLSAHDPKKIIQKKRTLSFHSYRKIFEYCIYLTPSTSYPQVSASLL